MSTVKESTHNAPNAYIHFGTWDDETRAHPAMKWMETYTRDLIDKQRWDEAPEKYHKSQFSVQKPNGQFVRGVDAAWKTVQELYAPFKTFRHEPNFLVYWDAPSSGGKKEWGMMGSADVWFRLEGLEGNTHTDKEGGKWDGVNSGAFLFHYVEDSEGEGGIKLQSTRIFTDAGPTMKLMLQKGMIDAETLKGIVIGS